MVTVPVELNVSRQALTLALSGKMPPGSEASLRMSTKELVNELKLTGFLTTVRMFELL
jgi:hypothetical protein